MAKHHLPKQQIDLYDQLVTTNYKIERKGATMPYTSLNGNMFSFLGPNGLALRMREVDRISFIKKYRTKLYKSGQTTLKEYVAVPDKLLKNTRELKKYFDASYKYALTLKPKTTKKKK